VAYAITTAYKKLNSMKQRVRILQGGTCFAKGTLVLMSDGSYKPIDKIVGGDYVLSRGVNGGIIKTEVIRQWENQPCKPILNISINGERIKATYDHKFYTPSGYKELYKIAWGAMAESQRLQLKLLCEQYGADIDINPLRAQELTSYNETSKSEGLAPTERHQLLSESSYGRQDSKTSQGGSSNLDTKPEQLPAGESQERQQIGQPSRELGVVQQSDEPKTRLPNGVTSANAGREEPQSEANSRRCYGDTQKLEYGHGQANPKRIRPKVWRIGADDKGRFGKSKLEVATVDDIRVQEWEAVYAIETETGNYFVSRQNVAVSNSAGKTIAILLWLINYATKNKGKLITIAAVSYPHLRRGAMRDFKNILTENNYWEYYQIQQNKAESTFTFFNGTTIEFVALDEGTARGARRDVLFVNECNLIPHATYDQLEVRTRELVILDYNPTTEFWVHTDVIPTTEHDFDIFTYKDNESLEDSIVKSIESRKGNKNWWKVYGLGQIGELEGLVYSGWTVTDIPEQAELLGYGLDFGFTNDPTAIVAVYKHDGRYILDEICYKTGLFNTDIADIIRANKLDRVLGVADSAEPKSIAELDRMGITIKGANKQAPQESKDSYRTWAVNKIQEMTVSYTPRSVNLQKEYLSYMWETNRFGKTLNVPQDGNDHALDASKYKLIDLISPKIAWAKPRGL